MPVDRQLLQTLRFLHLALCASTVIYGVVVFLATPAATPGDAGPSHVLLYVFAFLGASILLVGAPTVRRMLMGPTPERIRVASIATWAMCESVAVFGVIAAFLFHEPLYFVPFGVAGLGGLVFFAPRADQLGV